MNLEEYYCTLCEEQIYYNDTDGTGGCQHFHASEHDFDIGGVDIPKEWNLMTERGLEARYDVKRLNDPKGKHEYCAFFVLDLTHDPYARMAARAYATVCREAYPELSKDLQKLADNLSVKESQ